MTDPVVLRITPRIRDLGAFSVRRVLPATSRQMVGPFIFFDHMGPTQFAPGAGVDVRPHPHIGLATVTYLFEGELLHRDSLGTEQVIRPGAVNWMTAGRGIVHSERTAPAQRARGARLHGLQTWVALPKRHEETEPAFHHFGADALPVIEEPGISLRLIAGRVLGHSSPVRTFSETIYADVILEAGARIPLDIEQEDLAIYAVEGTVSIGGSICEMGQMAILRRNAAVELQAPVAARVIVLGGARVDGERHIWWNLVASSPARIQQAKRDWAAGRFPKVPGDDQEFIPLPSDG